MSTAKAIARLAVLRHGPTAWNEAGRIQGRSDPPLSPQGKAWVGHWQVPADLLQSDWHRELLGVTVTPGLLLIVGAWFAAIRRIIGSILPLRA